MEVFKVIQFFKKNSVFVFLVFVLIISLIGIVFFFGGSETSDDNPIELPPIIDSDNGDGNTATKPKTKIDSFVGFFDKKANISLKWTYSESKEKVKKIELFKGDTLIQDVTDANSYVINIFSSNYPTGDNEFELVLTLDNNEKISKKATVRIPYVLNVISNNEIVDDPELGKGVFINFTYQYYKTTPPSSPSLYVTNSTGSPFQIHYVKTAIIDTNNYYTAKTTFFLDVNNYEPGSYNYNLSCKFTSFNLTFNYPMNVVLSEEFLKGPIVDEEVPPVEIPDEIPGETPDKNPEEIPDKASENLENDIETN